MDYNNYFPFGMKMTPYLCQSTTDNKYQYNGKEQQTDFGLNWYDYGARFYDPTLGRWHSVDPSAEVYNSISPYVYCGNNPIRLSDLDGRDWLDKVVGFTNAIVDNATGIDRRGSFSPTDAADYNTWQDMGDVASVLMGASETDTGAGIAAGSVAVTVGSGGISLEVTGPALVGGTLLATHGSIMTGRAAQSLMSQKGRKNLVEEAKQSQAKKESQAQRETNKEAQKARGNSRTGNSNQGTKGSHDTMKNGKSNKNDHDTAEARRAREQKKANEKKN
jgi:RHS repeat-associated protein